MNEIEELLKITRDVQSRVDNIVRQLNATDKRPPRNGLYEKLSPIEAAKMRKQAVLGAVLLNLDGTIAMLSEAVISERSNEQV